MSKSYLLIRWIAEENLSILPCTAARSKDKLYVGAVDDFKWSGHYYNGEILKISGQLLYNKSIAMYVRTLYVYYTGARIESRAKLEKTMKKLLNFEVTREELLDNQLSDCEVDSTTGSAAPSKHRKRKPLGKPIVDKPDKGSKKKDALISAAKKRAMELFESKSSNSQTLPAKETSLESNKIAELQKELQQVKELLHQKSKGFIAIIL